MTPSPNQERCCSLCLGTDYNCSGAFAVCNIPTCECHPQNHNLQEKLIEGIAKAGMELVDAINTPQNHSTMEGEKTAEEKALWLLECFHGERDPEIRHAIREQMKSLLAKKEVSPMEGWEEEFDAGIQSFNLQIVEGAPRDIEGKVYRQFEAKIGAEVKDFIRTLLAKERESAERRGREKAVDFVEAQLGDDPALHGYEWVLEAARKDTTDV